ncbi:uncharacterized protein DS421_4g125260 [Arachis hypogaea]|nr:uncharacterized protein DS421_4g125260 [Arachis hypogaea]
MTDLRQQTLLQIAALWKCNSSPTKKHRHGNRNKKHLLMSAPDAKKQAMEESFPKKTEPKPPLNVDAHPRQWKDNVPSFSLGISPLASQPTPLSQVTVTQPTQPSEPTVSKLEVLADAVEMLG